MVSTTQWQEKPLPGATTESEQWCLDSSFMPEVPAPGGTGADGESNTQNPVEIARCQGQVEGIKA